MTTSLRSYTFTNFYLSSIQQGIQPAHAQTLLMRKYLTIDGEDSTYSSMKMKDMVLEWSPSPLTICLNGGNNKALVEFEETLKKNSDIPWASFREDDESLGGILTCVAIIVDKDIYEDAVGMIKKPNINSYYDKEEDCYIIEDFGKSYWLSSAEYSVVKKIASSPLAR